MEKFLFRHIDNTALVIFRIGFGLLLFLESIGAIFTGWVKENLVNPKFTFNFIGFDFLQLLTGSGMYLYYTIMGVVALFIMLGYKYKVAISTFFILWTATYFMQKSSYNNHYYLVVLLSFLMIFQPANRYASLDVKRRPELKSISAPYWTSFLLMLQIGIVYFFGAVAKMYPDWFQAVPVKILLSSKVDYPIVGSLFTQEWFHYLLSYGGLFFDLLLIPLLLIKRTRVFAFCLAIFFHLFNAFVFQIGIFPFLSLLFIIFFFDPKIVHRLFLKKKPFYKKNEVIVPTNKTYLLAFICIYFVIQIALPLRHWFIKGDVLFTEEGHRLSWRMMLRTKSGTQNFTVVDKKTKKKIKIRLTEHLSNKQIMAMVTKPDMIWQFAQYLKKDFEKNGKAVAIYVDGKVSVNGRPYQSFIDNTVDIAALKWDYFKHSYWILPFESDTNELNAISTMQTR